MFSHKTLRITEFGILITRFNCRRGQMKLSHKDDEKDEKEDENTENFYHQPTIGGHRSEVL